MTKYHPEKDILSAVIESKSDSPSAIAKWVLSKRNKVVDPHAVIMYLKRHPELKAEIESKLSGLTPNAAQPVDAALFQNGNFAEVPAVKEWLMFMAMRRRKGKALHPEYVKQSISILKQVCRDFKKHPDRLTFRDAQEIFIAIEAKGSDSCGFRRVLKDFLKSKNDANWQKIGVGKPRGFGTYKDMFVEKPTLDKMLDWVFTQSQEVYAADELMFHNGLRINAVLTAKIEELKTKGTWSTITVLEKFRETKTFKIVPFVANLLKGLIANRTEGNIFTITDTQAAEINGKAIDLFCPEIRIKYKNIHPNHFWRHMAAQHLLRVTDRNSKAVAALMQCTEQSLNESYGGATSDDVEKWENEYLGKL